MVNRVTIALIIGYLVYTTSNGNLIRWMQVIGVR